MGASAAGMASTIRLQQEGYEVELFEKDALPGGADSSLNKKITEGETQYVR
ncbi:NAD(P)-binding protein [Solibacillus sp. FSL K6-1781]